MEKETILVIEDNEFNRKLVRTLLQLGEYHVLEAVDAESGLKLVRERRPTMVLMDIQLPGMDGLEATRAIMKDPDLKDTPVVALTAHAMRGDEEKALEAGCVGYIAKPIDTRTFLDTVNQYKHQKPKTATDKGDYRHRVLIVDDDPINTKLLASMLPKDKYAIITATSGEMCIEKTVREHPDLILLDIMMPDLNGYEVTRQLKKDPTTKNIPVMLITALDEQADKIKGLEAGADDFLNKPVNTFELRARVQSLLRLKVYHEQLKTRSQSEDSVLMPSAPSAADEETIYSPLILVVEDDEKDVRLFQEYLDREGFRLKIVGHGEAAIEFAREESIDLILLDIMLPGMDGFEVIRQLKKMARHRNAQLVVVTQMDDLNNKIRGINLGIDDYLIKPINREELIARVHALLKKKAYMDRLSTQFENALQAAISDKLTGIYNHAYFKHFMDLEVKRAIRQKHPLALIMIDIDNFKEYNDTYGHPVGDALLKWIGKVLRESIREVDVPARYGGEEFAVVLPYADREGASVVAERIRTAISAESFATPDMKNTGKVTVSMGIAHYPEDAASAKELIKLADKALYRAKREGKDRICIYQKDAETPAETEAPVHNHSPRAGDIEINHQNELAGL